MVSVSVVAMVIPIFTVILVVILMFASFVIVNIATIV